MADERVRGAKVRGGGSIPKNTHTPAIFNVIWDSDGYFRPTIDNGVLTIPRPRRRGRYQIRVAVRWMNPWGLPGGARPSYDDYSKMNYYTCITVNDSLLGNEARATAAPVLAATGTTQYFAVDENLGLGDSVGVRLWQSVGDDVMANVFLEIRRLGPRASALTTSATGSSDSASDTG